MLAVTWILLLIFVQQQGTDAKPPVRCRTWGNAHVTPFSANETDSSQEIWWHQTGLTWLVKNKYVLSTVLIGPSPYYISDFNFVLLDDNGLVRCTINREHVLQKTAPDCSAHGIEISFKDTTAMITYKKANFLALIAVDDWSIPAISITAWLDRSLAKVSDGICKTGYISASTDSPTQVLHLPVMDKTQKSVQANAEKICTIYIEQALSKLNFQANNKKNSQVMEIENSKTACITDLVLTGDIKAATASVIGLSLYKLAFNALSLHTLQMDLTSGLEQALGLNSIILTEATTKINHIIFANHHIKLPTMKTKAAITMGSVVKDVLVKFQKAYPNDTFVVITHTSSAGATRYNGDLLLCIQLGRNGWLDIYRLSKSSGSAMNTYEIKRRAFPFVYDTKSEKNIEKRGTSIRHSLADTFPKHNVNVFIFSNYWSWSVVNGKGSANFTGQYGSDVLVVLN